MRLCEADGTLKAITLACPTLVHNAIRSSVIYTRNFRSQGKVTCVQSNFRLSARDHRNGHAYDWFAFHTCPSLRNPLIHRSTNINTTLWRFAPNSSKNHEIRDHRCDHGLLESYEFCLPTRKKRMFLVQDVGKRAVPQLLRIHRPCLLR